MKCDEEKPTCYRCRSTGRRCDGYQSGPIPNSNPRNVKIIQYVPSIPRQTQRLPHPYFSDLTTEQEWRSWEFFYLQTASCFGHKAGDFLLSVATIDPLIRTAALALGSLHRMFLYEGDHNGADTSAGRQTALRQYNMAMRRGLHKLSQSSADSIDTILVMCALFYCAECLQGYYQAALLHVASGVRILRHQEQLRLGCSGYSYRPREEIQYILAVMENQLLEVGGELSLPDSIKLYTSTCLHVPFEDPSQTMSTLEELGDAFKILYNKFLHVLSSAETSAKDASEEVQAQLEAQYMDVLERMSRFSTAFDRFLATNPQHQMDENAHMYMITLQVWRNTVGVVLNAGWPPCDSAWDKHTADYAVICSLAEEMMSKSSLALPGPAHPISTTGNKGKKQPSAGHSGRDTTRPIYTCILPKPQPPRSPPLFSLSLGVLPVLWIVAVSCRDSKTRYRAIHLMARCKRQEGIWDSRLYAQVAARVARLEEQVAGIPEGADYEPSDVPMSARVSTVVGLFEEGRRGKVQFLWHNHEKLEESVVW